MILLHYASRSESFRETNFGLSKYDRKYARVLILGKLSILSRNAATRLAWSLIHSLLPKDFVELIALLLFIKELVRLAVSKSTMMTRNFVNSFSLSSRKMCQSPLKWVAGLFLGGKAAGA